MNRNGLITSGRGLHVQCPLLLLAVAFAGVAGAAEGQPTPGGAKAAEVYRAWPFDATEAARMILGDGSNDRFGFRVAMDVE